MQFPDHHKAHQNQTLLKSQGLQPNIFHKKRLNSLLYQHLIFLILKFAQSPLLQEYLFWNAEKANSL
ncbi:hypothetical protein D3C78_1686550 [compost metagenome]